MPTAGKDFCGQCSRRVHNLDGMSQAQRAAFFDSCAGEVCVAYTVRRPGVLAGVMGLGVAAAAIGAPTAHADTPSDAASAAAAPAEIPVIRTGPTCDPDANKGGLDTILVGGIKMAREVQWIDAAEATRAAPRIGEIDSADWLPTPDATK